MDVGIGLGTAVATVQGNFIGVDAAQAGVISSGTCGISHPGPAGSTIGGTGPGEGNVIGGFDYGIFLDSRAAPLYGNFIGTDTTATKNFGNRIMGIFLSTSHQVVGGVGAGEGNVIAFNGWVGIHVTISRSCNPIRGNRIFNNGFGGVGANGVGLAIDLDINSTPSGQNPNDLGDADGQERFGNDFQNYPLITSAVPEGGGTASSARSTASLRPCSTSTSTPTRRPAGGVRGPSSRPRPTSARRRSRPTARATPRSTFCSRRRSPRARA